ncbi:vWA domain-containing protein [Paramuribaculum intestinale]|uniref:vWA domain-containing protein n=1 Tax=Paramuribaculum intestinale TaxID=2094151 RepID=UPI0025B2638C|nr:VWA domain-containing protein [Paramuribaculum intestinale]
MQFAHPTYLWFLLLLIPYLAWYILNRKHATMSVSTIAPYAKNGRPLRAWLLHGLFVMRALCLAALIVILARPQAYDRWSTSNTQGTDIVIALDISTSMLARDFKPDRFEAAKKVASQFVSGRESDNIGVVIFAGESFTAVPMTTDKALLVNYINDIKMGMLQDATAIGDGLATSINHIKDGKAKSKSIILLTAAEIAKKYGIKVYTIGIGRNGMAPFPQENAFGRIEYVNLPVVIDEATLRDIASITGGKYFRATDNNVLKQVFDEIDALEKTVLDVRNFSHTEENYMMWAWIAFALLALELLLRFTVLRTIP